MPFTTLVDAQPLTHGTSYGPVAFPLSGTRLFRLHILITYAAAPTSVATATLLPGFGPHQDQGLTPEYATNDPATVDHQALAAPELNTDTSLFDSKTVIRVHEEDYPNLDQLVINNPDVAEDGVLTVYAETH